MNKILVKWVLIFGGGLLGFTLFKPKKQTLIAANTSVDSSADKSFDDTESDIKPTVENAEIVARAYGAAMQNNEPNATLSELNKECMKDYGLRCYMDKGGKLVVCDKSGDIILKK
jgi:hypothetical protein